MFTAILKVATFDVLPVGVVISGFEDLVELDHDDESLSDTMRDLGYDSSDPIRNLQIMFIFMAILLFYPLTVGVLRLIFFWSSKCMKWQTKFRRVVYFNLYIRFAFEAYLEVSLTALIRLQNLKFGSYSDNFNSIFAIVLLVSALSFMLVTCVKL